MGRLLFSPDVSFPDCILTDCIPNLLQIFTKTKGNQPRLIVRESGMEQIILGSGDGEEVEWQVNGRIAQKKNLWPLPLISGHFHLNVLQ